MTAILAHHHLRNFISLTYGGTVPNSGFFAAGTIDLNAGVKMWYCHNNDTEHAYPFFFLASEQIMKDQIKSDEPVAETLVTASAVYMYPGNCGGKLKSEYIDWKAAISGRVINFVIR